MKKLILLLLPGALLACNNNSKTDMPEKEKQNEKKEENTTIKKDQEKPADSTGYTWTAAEQNKFLKDCEKESGENIRKGKLKDFCLCMLTEAQKYYSSYKQMDDKGDEDNDEEIYKKCVGEFGEEED